MRLIPLINLGIEPRTLLSRTDATVHVPGTDRVCSMVYPGVYSRCIPGVYTLPSTMGVYPAQYHGGYLSPCTQVGISHPLHPGGIYTLPAPRCIYASLHPGGYPAHAPRWVSRSCTQGGLSCTQRCLSCTQRSFIGETVGFELRLLARVPEVYVQVARLNVTFCSLLVRKEGIRRVGTGV